MMKKVVVFLIAITIILGIIQLYLCGFLGAQGIELGEIEEKIQILEAQNRQLVGEVARYSSLLKIQEEAVSLGFRTNTVAQSQ